MNIDQKNRIDVNSKQSTRQGFSGQLESFVRTFRNLSFSLMLLPIVVLYILCMGLSLTPGMLLLQSVYTSVQDHSLILKSLALGMSFATAFFLYGFSLIFIVPLVNKILFLKIKPMKTSWFDLAVIPWYYHNALTYLVRYTFLDIITPTPLNKLFYQMMGMKIGQGSVINTSNISDPCLIEIGNNVTIGGSATLIAHYGQKGILIIGKLTIEDNVTIGLRASVFGDVVIGQGAQIKAHDVVMPKSRVHAENH